MAYPFRPQRSNEVKKSKKEKKPIAVKPYLTKSHTHRNTSKK